MDLQTTRYLHIRHWDYWYDVYHIHDRHPNSVEFCITEDEAGEQFFFHFDITNQVGMEQLLTQDDYIKSDDPTYTDFCAKVEALRKGEIPFFVGALFFQHYTPSIQVCNAPLEGTQSLLDIRSPSVPPYYADIFVNEFRPLTPEVLLEWVARLSPTLFHQSFECKIANVPSQEETLHMYAQDHT